MSNDLPKSNTKRCFVATLSSLRGKVLSTLSAIIGDFFLCFGPTLKSVSMRLVLHNVAAKVKNVSLPELQPLLLQYDKLERVCSSRTWSRAIDSRVSACIGPV